MRASMADKGGACQIVSQNNMPSCKFVSPKNLDTIKANADFTVGRSGTETPFA